MLSPIKCILILNASNLNILSFGISKLISFEIYNLICF